jgi:hypothetical protein
LILTCIGDFPPVEKMKKKFKGLDFSTFEKWDQDLFDAVSQVLHNDLPKLLLVYLLR